MEYRTVYTVAKQALRAVMPTVLRRHLGNTVRRTSAVLKNCAILISQPLHNPASTSPEAAPDARRLPPTRRVHCVMVVGPTDLHLAALSLESFKSSDLIKCDTFHLCLNEQLRDGAAQISSIPPQYHSLFGVSGSAAFLAELKIFLHVAGEASPDDLIMRVPPGMVLHAEDPLRQALADHGALYIVPAGAAGTVHTSLCCDDLLIARARCFAPPSRQKIIKKVIRQCVEAKTLPDRLRPSQLLRGVLAESSGMPLPGNSLAPPTIKKECQIAQARFSVCVSNFESEFLEKHPLRRYDNPWEPALFMGCYTDADFDALRSHAAPKVLVWRGTDAASRDRLEATKKIPALVHVAISPDISRDLTAAGIPHLRLPISSMDYARYNLRPVPRGSAVYVYLPSIRAKEYGAKIVSRLRRELTDIEFIITEWGKHSRTEVIELYKRCYLGLRLMRHDGLSNTALEMALLGIPTVANSGLPWTLPYSGIADVRKHILEQRKYIGTENWPLHQLAKDYLTLPEDWLQLSFYERQLRG